jgi:hypothetical protein
MKLLRGRGYDLDAKGQSRLVSSLLVVICGDSKVQPTYSIHDSQE